MSNGDRGLPALLRYIAGVRDEALNGIRSRAAGESQTLTRAARAKAAAQVRQALVEARQDAAARIGLARAQAQARLRQARQALTAGTLQGIWPRIEQVLLERWQDRGARRRWVEQALAQARLHLFAGEWRISHPAAWDPQECAAALASLRAERAGLTVVCEARSDLAAGIRIASGPAELDMTVAGLLRDRGRIAGRWLAEVEAARRASPQLRTGT